MLHEVHVVPFRIIEATMASIPLPFVNGPVWQPKDPPAQQTLLDSFS